MIRGKSNLKLLIVYMIVMLVISCFFFSMLLINDEKNETSDESSITIESNVRIETTVSEKSEDIFGSKEIVESIHNEKNIDNEESSDSSKQSEYIETSRIKSIDDPVIASLEKENKIISLEEGLRLLNNDIDDENVIIRQLDISEHKKYVKNVCIEGLLKELLGSAFYLDDVRAGEKVYNNFIISWDGLEIDRLLKLRKGDKVTAVVTICKKNSDEYDRYSDDNERDFHIVKDGDLGQKYFGFDISDKEDELELKYKDKDKVYDFADVYEDLTQVFSENYFRAMHIFRNIKIKAKAKVDSLVPIYSYFYYVYKFEKPIPDTDEKYKYAIMNLLGYDKKQSYYAFSNDSLVIYKAEKSKYVNAEVELMAEVDRIKRNSTYEDMVFELGSRNADIRFTVLEDNNADSKKDLSSKVNNIRELKIETFNEIYQNLDKIKVVGKDKINLYDDCCFGHVTIDIDGEIVNPDTGVVEKTAVNKNVPLIWRVIKIDENDDNKLLLMLETPNVIEKMAWSDSTSPVTYKDSAIRKFLNENFYNGHFDSNEKNKIYESEITSTIFKSFYDKIAAETMTTSDKVFILSSQEINDNKEFFIDQYQTSFIRDQRYGKDRYSLYRRNIIVFPYDQGSKIDEHEQETYKLDEKWSVYPCMYVDAKVR